MDENLTSYVLSYGNQIYDGKTNQIVLMHVIRDTKDPQRFDEPLKRIVLNYRNFLHIC